MKSNRGFTLIELLIVITIIAALAVTVFAALNPAQRLKDARAARRVTDVETILTAIHETIVDNKGSYPSNLAAAGTVTQLGNGSSGCTLGGSGNCSVTSTVCSEIITGTISAAAYLKSMPIDPLGGTTYTASKSGYTVLRDANGIITVTACGSEATTPESASR
ncbi:MAG: type II secretion system protein [Patescibacteria group bacterium]